MIEDAKAQEALADKESEETWLAAARIALAANRKTFAVLPIDDLVRPEELRAPTACTGILRR